MGYKSHFSDNYTQSRGVATFINNNFEVKNDEKDNEGNLLILDCNISDVTLVNIYGPNRDTSQSQKILLSLLLGEILI